MDYSIALKNGLVLKGMMSAPREDPKAFIVMVHGLGEHIQRYDSWAAKFSTEGIGFTGVDLPGHGRSGGKRGYVRSYLVTREMVDLMYESVSKTFPGVPLFLYGHSLGGGIVLDYLLNNNPGFRGLIVTSPWLRLSFEPGRLKLILASVMKSLLPSLVQPSGLVVDHLSHDREVVEKYKSDPLVHDRISVSLFHSATSAASTTLMRAGELKIPLLIMHGSDDKICSPQGSREFALKAPQAELKIWEGGYHELHNEPFRDDVFACILSWIHKQM